MARSQLLRHFFPRRSLRSQLPLSPRGYQSSLSPWGAPPAAWMPAILTLQWRGLAHNDAGAYRLLKKHGYPDTPLSLIIRRETKPRKWWSALHIAWSRFRKMW